MAEAKNGDPDVVLPQAVKVRIMSKAGSLYTLLPAGAHEQYTAEANRETTKALCSYAAELGYWTTQALRVILRAPRPRHPQPKLGVPCIDRP